MSEQGRQEIPHGKGLRHVALNVTDLEVSKTFYQTWFGMTTVWEPDADNVYMSSGVDNLALHQIPKENVPAYQHNQGQFLDHLGFVMSSPESVDQLYERVVEAGVEIIHHPKQHRDGSYSFYLADPDRIVIQILYEPTISPMRFSTET